MKIKLTESQYGKIISENLNDKEERFLNMFFDRVKNLNYKDALDVYFRDFGFDARMMEHSKKIYDWFRYIILPKFVGNQSSLHGINKGVSSLFDLIIERELDGIVGSDRNGYQKLNAIINLEKLFPWHYNSDKMKTLREVGDGLIYDAVEDLFKQYEPKEAIRQASLLKDKMGSRKFESVNSIVKGFAEKNGLTIIPKHGGYTFQRGEETMIRDLINYMRDIPQKTKRGFLNYIGSDYGAGQYSTFWSAVNKAGIIQKVGGGNNVTYQLGPNYKAWEEGKTVAF